MKWKSNQEKPTHYYVSRETNESAYDTVCPQCGEEIILEPHTLLGVAPGEGKHDRIGIRGI